MAIDRTPVMKRARSLGIEAAFTGSTKKSKKKPPMTRKKVSEYGLQLKEKQKAKFCYGILEKQFRKYYDRASKMREGITGENLLMLLEMRLDNVVYRLGLARTRREARQLVSHKLITVNGRKVNIPSYHTKPGDVIAVSESRKDSVRFKDILAATEGRRVESWLDVDINNLQGSIISTPTREQIDTPVNETFIVELYSK
ncbi:MAG: 30S ribosomal protein S4 [Clostridiales bacterium]|jgi:small subunit ribosomal protein S4|nr:30S ribosomal protein S4 [Clostridiales bacterium]